MKGSELHTKTLPGLSPSELSRAVGGDLDTDWGNWDDWSGFDFSEQWSELPDFSDWGDSI